MSRTIAEGFLAESCLETDGQLTGAKADTVGVLWSQGGVELGIRHLGAWITFDPDSAEAFAHSVLVAARAARRHNR